MTQKILKSFNNYNKLVNTCCLKLTHGYKMKPKHRHKQNKEHNTTQNISDKI